MLVIVICVVIVAAVSFWVGFCTEEIILVFASALVAGVFVSAFIAIPGIKATGGLVDGYSVGERRGYLTKVSVEGVVWKTNEGEMQVGTGSMAALQEPWEFSVPDESVLSQITGCLGKHSVVSYRRWLLQPYKRGNSGYEVTSVSCNQP